MVMKNVKQKVKSVVKSSLGQIP